LARARHVALHDGGKLIDHNGSIAIKSATLENRLPNRSPQNGEQKRLSAAQSAASALPLRAGHPTIEITPVAESGVGNPRADPGHWQV
jgi:hypothetical protein